MNIDDDQIIDIEIYKGLQSLSELSFPKQCSVCGRRYETVADFVKDTEPVRSSTGLKQGMDDNASAIVELYRNCPCGSTLMDEFNDRRNLSTSGIKRREKFGELMERICASGYSVETARQELLSIMKGHGSTLLNVRKSNFPSKIKTPGPHSNNQSK